MRKFEILFEKLSGNTEVLYYCLNKNGTPAHLSSVTSASRSPMGHGRLLQSAVLSKFYSQDNFLNCVKKKKMRKYPQRTIDKRVGIIL